MESRGALLAAAMAVVASALASTPFSSARELTFEERVAAQEAVERVGSSGNPAKFVDFRFVFA